MSLVPVPVPALPQSCSRVMVRRGQGCSRAWLPGTGVPSLGVTWVWCEHAGTQQMALPPHTEELGTQLLPTVTSLKGPGHRQAAWPWGRGLRQGGGPSPSANPGHHILTQLLLLGGGRDTEQGPQPSPPHCPWGRDTEMPLGRSSQAVSCISVFLLFQDNFPWVFFK